MPELCIFHEMDNMLFTDVVVLGAGPAGATATIALKYSGLKVVLIDKEFFPRDKICGDAISIYAKKNLMDISPDMHRELEFLSNEVFLNSAKLYSPRFDILEVDFERKGLGYVVKRIEFDNMLFKMASDKSYVTVIQGVKANSVSTKNEYAEVRLSNGQVVRSKVIIGCDGAHSIAAKQLGNIKLDRQHYSGAIRQYYSNITDINRSTLEVFFVKGHLPGYFWIFPLKNNEANVGFGMLSDVISKRKIDLRASLNDIITNVPEISRRFQYATPLEEPRGFGLPLGSRTCTISGNRFMLCGDAASLIDPFTGEGIDAAMRSGRYAAEQVLHCCKTDDFSADNMKSYSDRVYQKIGKNFRYHYTLQRILGDREWIINLLITVCKTRVVQKRISRLFY